jgi:enoyl-CoA hydratase/carnithine racemase
LLEFLDVAEQRQRAPCAVRDTAGQHFCAVGQFPNLEGEDDGGMRAGRRMGRRKRGMRSIPAVNSLERADVKMAARTSRPSPLGRYSVEEPAVRTRPRI